MIPLKQFLRQLPKAEAESFAHNCDTPLYYLKLISTRYRAPGRHLAALLQLHSKGEVSAKEFHPEMQDEEIKAYWKLPRVKRNKGQR